MALSVAGELLSSPADMGRSGGVANGFEAALRLPLDFEVPTVCGNSVSPVDDGDPGLPWFDGTRRLRAGDLSGEPSIDGAGEGIGLGGLPGARGDSSSSLELLLLAAATDSVLNSGDAEILPGLFSTILSCSSSLVPRSQPYLSL